jgi:hypothetical protein
MKVKEQSLDYFKNAIKDIRKISNDIAVIVVANNKTKSQRHEDYSKHSLTTEFYAEKELEEIINGFRDNGIYVEYYPNEIAFIQWGITRRDEYNSKEV